MVPRVVEVFIVMFVSVVAIEVIRVFDAEVRGGRAEGLIERGGERRVDVVEGGDEGAKADIESFEFSVGKVGEEFVFERAADFGCDNCEGGVSFIGGGEMTFLEY